MLAAGYEIAVGSEQVGWSVISRTNGASRVVLVQGHPEYDPSSLLREYHRDVRRYVLGRARRGAAPAPPLRGPGRLGPARSLHDRIVGGDRDPALVESFPFDEMGDRADWPWRETAIGLYANWMADATERND